VIIRNAFDWHNADQAMKKWRELPMPKDGYELTLKKVEKARSLSQNALSHVWYAQVAKEENEYTAAEVKRNCKLHFGVPILRENPDYSEMIGKILDPLGYEDRVKAMDYLSVSSLMKKPQMSRYLEAIQAHYASRVNLEFQ
jgi:hypothetical protein